MPLFITSFIVVSRFSIPASPTNFHNSIGKLSGPLEMDCELASSEEVCLAGEPIPCTNTFKYLGSTIEATGGYGADVDNRVRSAWNSWRGLSVVICDQKVPVKLKNKLYKTVIRSTLIYGSECWALHRTEQQRMHTTEMKMLRWIQGKSRKDRIRNEKFRSDAMVRPITTYATQKRLSWYGHVMRRE